MAYKVRELNIYELGTKIAEVLLSGENNLSFETIQLKLEKDYCIFAKLDEIRLVVDKFVEKFSGRGFIKLIDSGESVFVEVINNDIFNLLAGSPKVVEMFLGEKAHIKSEEYLNKLYPH